MLHVSVDLEHIIQLIDSKRGTLKKYICPVETQPY